MLILVRLIGLYFVITGVVFIFNPKTLKQYIAFWSQGKRLYMVGASRLFSAVVLLLAVPQCRFKWVVASLGGLNILLGIPYFVRGIEGMKVMLSFWDKRPLKAVRILGIVSLAVGVLLIYSAG
jgi:uncharacterized protein YjeT (DUF2065 family)